MRVTEIVRLATQPIERLLIPQETTAPMIQGTLYHAHILRQDWQAGDAPASVEIIPCDSYRTKESQYLKAKALESSRTPALTKEWADIIATPKPTMQALHDIFKADKFEIEVKGKVRHFGEIVGHIDSLNSDFISDLKISAQNDRLDKKIFDMGYQLQMFLYMELAQIEHAKLVFFNPQANAIFVKELAYYELITECEALLDLAYKNFCEIDKVKERGGFVESSAYAPPQWALSELLHADQT